MYLINNLTTPSAIIVSWQGIKIATLLQLWLVMVNIELYLLDFGNLVIKSIAIKAEEARNPHPLYKQFDTLHCISYSFYTTPILGILF